MRPIAAYRGQALLACASLGIGVLASLYTGVPTSDVSLHDGGVWVVNLEKRAAAHLNYPSMTLDGAVLAPSGDFDLTQSANDVVLTDTTGATMSPLDTAAYSLGSAAQVPTGLVVAQGGQTVAVTDPVRGAVWVMDADGVEAFSEEQEPLVDKAVGAVSAVALDGTVHVVSDSGKLRRITRSGSAWTSETSGTLDGLTPGELAITVVGSAPVVLDRGAGQVRTLEETSAVAGAADLVLQPPGQGARSVALASPTDLVLVPLDGGEAATAGPGAGVPGIPAPPVRVGTCTYAAWGGTGHYQRVCDDAGDDAAASVERLASTGDPVFRVNRDVVVLNTRDTGDVFLVNKDMALVANWDDVLGQLEDDEEEQEETREQDEQFNPNRSSRNNPPKANPDSYGIRPGRSTTLPVLDNDTDLDGDVLVASTTEELSLGAVRQVRGGEALQVVADAKAVGTESFLYKASDGRGRPGQARVQVEVHPWSVNEAPRRKDRASVVTVAGGAEVKYNLLQDWIDPDGDPVFLASVRGTPEIRATSREDGTVTITDLGRAKPGLHEIEVRVSDGREIATGTLNVDLRGPENVAPTANADHVLVVTDEETVVSPLDNDTDPNGDLLRLAQVSNPGGGAKVLLDPAAGTFTVTARRTGTFYVEYVVSDGPATATNVVRVDVVDGSVDEQPPVADNDLALLPTGQSVLVPVLANDHDPMGGVLVVQSVTADPDARLQLDIVNHEFVRVRAVGVLRGPAAFSYTISNGVASATAQVTVVAVPDAGSDRAPVVEDDKATVRAGDVVTIAALANDRSPANLDLRIDEELELLPATFPGKAFVSGRHVRFKAGDKPGRMRIMYTVFDSAENYTSGTIVVTVVPGDAPNTPPTPAPLVARVLAGGSVRIPVPTDGVDAEGDSVTLLGVASPAPTKGVVRVVGNSLKYTAPASSSGTDKFRYLVEDASGAQATGNVRVGIAPPSALNQLPTAVVDVVKVRPGRKLAVPVTANDTDPDGDTPLLVPDSVRVADQATTVKAGTDGSYVVLRTPKVNGDLNYYYGITDRPGGQVVDGVLTVQVRDKAPLRAPVAQDDVVTAAEVIGENAVDVDVLANDADPDGVAEDLKISADERDVSVVGGKLRIPLLASRRVVLYTVTDIDGLSSSAVVTVPGLGDQRPILKPGAPAVKVVAGKTVRLSLSDHVQVRAGHKPSLTFGSTVQPGPGGSAEALDQTSLSFTASRGFAGPTAVTFEVTDGRDADDADGLKAVLTVPVEVRPAPTDDVDDDDEEVSTPPTFVPTRLQVAAGEDAVTADLRAMVTDPDPGDMDRLKFSLVNVGPGGVKADLSGDRLSASAPMDTKVGTSALVTVSVTDGSTDPVEAQIPVEVVSSTRPLVQVRGIEIPDANAGGAVRIDIAEHVTNPFAADGQPVRLLGAQSAGGSASGKVSTSGTTITVTPDRGTHGQMSVSFTVGDATQDPARVVEGLARITVRDKPDAPTSVTAVSHESGTATITWVAPANNGAVISGYDVAWNGGRKDCGQATTCTVTGLKNAVEYTFTVGATNEVGASERSAASNPVKPDRRPDAPASVSGEFGDKSAKLVWDRPVGDFSAVTSYSIILSPGDASGRTQIDGITQPSAVVDNLVNGTAYTFSILAHNEHPEPSDPSPASAPVVPAGVPFAAAAPTVQKRAASATQPSATVRWGAPDGNGDNNLVYTLRASNGRSWEGLTATSQEVLMDASTSDVTFTVTARNKAGTGAVSPASAAQRFFSKPGPVSNLRVDETGRNNEVKFSFTRAEGNGATPAEMTYRWRVGGAQGTIPAGGGTITHGAFANGANVTVDVWATSLVRGETAVGDARSDTANAYGPPTLATVSHSDGYQSVTFSWNAGGTGNGRPVTGTRIRTGSGWENVAASGSRTYNVGPGTRVDFYVQAQNAAGWGPEQHDAGTSWAASSASWRKSSADAPNGWKYVELLLTRYRPDSNVRCHVGGINEIPWEGVVHVDGNGNWGWGVPSGSMGRPTAGNITVDGGFGTCTQL